MPSETEVIMKQRSIMEMHPDQRPDEKFLTYGPEALSDAELLAIILRTGSKDESSIELADRLLRPENGAEGSILSIFDYELEDLMKIKGIGKVKALQIKAVIELSRRIAVTSAEKRLDFSDPETIARYYMEQLRHENRERVVLVMLNSACELISDEIISLGTINASLYSTREIFLTAMKYGAVNIILLHNHPSGNPAPSVSDIEATKKIAEAGRLIDIKLLDHIIVGDRTYLSFKKENLL